MTISSVRVGLDVELGYETGNATSHVEVGRSRKLLVNIHPAGRRFLQVFIRERQALCHPACPSTYNASDLVQIKPYAQAWSDG
jgi:hypothetical protein